MPFTLETDQIEWIESAFEKYKTLKVPRKKVEIATFKAVVVPILKEMLGLDVVKEQGLFSSKASDTMHDLLISKSDNATSIQKKSMVVALREAYGEQCDQDPTMKITDKVVNLSDTLKQAWIDAVNTALAEEYSMAERPTDQRVKATVKRFINEALNNAAVAENLEITDDNFFEEHIEDPKTGMGLVETLLSKGLKSAYANADTIKIKQAMKMTYTMEFDVPSGP